MINKKNLDLNSHDFDKEIEIFQSLKTVIISYL